MKQKLRKILTWVRRIGLNGNNFTIVSNNCFAGFLYQKFGISEEIEELSTKVEKNVENIFKKIDEICTKNSLKVSTNNVEDKIYKEIVRVIKERKNKK